MSTTKDVHTSGTSHAHIRHTQNQEFHIFEIFEILLYSFDVPDLCIYLWVFMTRKYGSKAFQCRVTRLSTTKTRFCGSIQDLMEKSDFRSEIKFFIRKLIFQNFHQNSIWATGTSFWATKLLWYSFESSRSTLNSFECCKNVRSICTHQAHETYMTKIIKKWYFFSVVCLMCAWDVPDVCTYLGVLMSQKYGPRRFQRRVARLSTTKTRPCSSNQTFAHLGQMCKL